MQTDFREERRWKIALAYELAICVQEWHIAGSKEERVRLGITGEYKKPVSVDYVPSATNDDQVEIPADDHEDSDAASDEDVEMSDSDAKADGNDKEQTKERDSSEEDAQDQRAVHDALNPDAIFTEALDEAEQNVATTNAETGESLNETSSTAVKLEESESNNLPHIAQSSSGDIQMGEAGENKASQPSEEMKAETTESASGLKDSSSNPILNVIAEPSTEVQEVSPPKEQKPLFTPEQTKRLRSSLASLPGETLFVSLDQLLSISEEELLKSFPADEDPSKLPEWDPRSVFPEMQAFGMQEVSKCDIVGGIPVDGKKRGDKKLDKDDPSRRIDETVYNKLYPASRFMNMKPTLVSALQPARRWRKGKWVELDESPVVSDVDAPLPPISPDTTSCELYVLYALNGIGMWM